jgi:hypothetical protein
VVVVAEVETPLPADILDLVAESASDEPFRLGPDDGVLARLHESAVSEAED